MLEILIFLDCCLVSMNLILYFIWEQYQRLENVKVIPGDYTVFVSSKGIAQFTNRKQAIEYFIALEPDSTYNES